MDYATIFKCNAWFIFVYALADTYILSIYCVFECNAILNCDLEYTKSLFQIVKLASNS